MACKKVGGMGDLLRGPFLVRVERPNQAAQPNPKKARGKEVCTGRCARRQPESEGCQLFDPCKHQKGLFRPSKCWAVRVVLLPCASARPGLYTLPIHRDTSADTWPCLAATARPARVVNHVLYCCSSIRAAAGLISKDRWQPNHLNSSKSRLAPRWCSVEAKQLLARGQNRPSVEKLGARKSLPPAVA